jgi:FKBP-type peptidyl-prolyl cis-trans isomerase
MYKKSNIFLFPKLIALLMFAAIFSGCKDDSDISAIDRLANEQIEIEQYLKDKGLTSVKTSSGLHHIIVEEGTGTSNPNMSSDVQVQYRGSLLNGEIFDQSAENKTITFALSRVIVGWQEGLQLMKLNEKSILIIPSHLGYGGQSIPGIPANSVLVFDVDLKGFN